MSFLLNCKMHIFDCTTSPVTKGTRFFVPPSKKDGIRSSKHKLDLTKKYLFFPQTKQFQTLSLQTSGNVHIA